MKSYQFCNNCGKNGHLYHCCKKPITSSGIIGFKKDKQNKFTPGTKIPIYKYSGFIEKNIDFVFLGAWNFKEEIFQKEKKFIKKGGKFIIHTPIPRII